MTNSAAAPRRSEHPRPTLADALPKRAPARPTLADAPAGGSPADDAFGYSAGDDSGAAKARTEGEHFAALLAAGEFDQAARFAANSPKQARRSLLTACLPTYLLPHHLLPSRPSRRCATCRLPAYLLTCCHTTYCRLAQAGAAPLATYLPT